jgi:cell division septation protein DedD
MGGFERFCWAVTALASIAAAALLGSAYFGHGLGVPQETAFAAVAVAVIPYVFTRAIQAMGRGMRQEAAEDYPAAEAPGAEPERRVMPAPSLPIPEAQAEPEPSWAEPVRIEPERPERSEAQMEPEPSWVEPVRVEPEQAQPSGTEPPRTRRRRAGLFRADFPRAARSGPEFSRTEPSGAELRRSEPAFGLQPDEPAREPLIARDRLVEPPPPKSKRDGMGRVFWFLVGILVILLLVAAFLVLKGP